MIRLLFVVFAFLTMIKPEAFIYGLVATGMIGMFALDSENDV